MRQRGRSTARWLVAVFALAILILALGMVFYAFKEEGLSRAADVAQIVGLLTLAPSVIGIAFWARKPGGSTDSDERTADDLADQLSKFWGKIADERGLKEPVYLRWRWSHWQVTGPVASAVVGVYGTRFRPLPGLAAITAEQLSGGSLGELHSVYGGLDSGRIVIHGAPGAGKSGAAILLLLDALKHRSGIRTSEERSMVPVPVLVTVHGWNPSEILSFTDWLARRIVRDGQLLLESKYDYSTVIRLIEGNRLAVILDGLDEMPEPLRQIALQVLDEQVTFRLVVFTRSEELIGVVGASGRHLQGAAALEIRPVEPNWAATYLKRCQLNPLPAPWQCVVDHLEENPSSPLTQALDTPLMLTLIRDGYHSGESVDKLTNRENFATREAVEDHLIARVLPAAYVQRSGNPIPAYTVDQAQQWLAHLARKMKHERTEDLAWWQIPRWVPAWPRALFTALSMYIACVVVSGLCVGLLNWFEVSAGIRDRTLAGVGNGVLVGSVYAPLIGLGYGLLPSVRDHRASGRADQFQRREAVAWKYLLVGLAIGFLSSIANSVSSVGFKNNDFFVQFKDGLSDGLIKAVGDGLVHGLVIGIGFAVVAGLVDGWNRSKSRMGLPVGLAFLAGLVGVVGFLSGLKGILISGLQSGLLWGLLDALIVGLGYGILAGFGGLAGARWGRLWWRKVVVVGVVIGLVVGIGSGVAFVLVVGIGMRSPLALNWSVRERFDLRNDLPIIVGSGLAAWLLVGPTIRIGGTSILGRGLEFWDALSIGLLVALSAVFLIGLGRQLPDAASAVNPRSLWRREIRTGIAIGLMSGLWFGIVVWTVSPLAVRSMNGLAIGVQVGLGAALVSSATWAAALAGMQLRRRRQAPVRLLRFLDDAHARNILQTVGPLYQFRHDRLRDWLAKTGDSPPKP